MVAAPAAHPAGVNDRSRTTSPDPRAVPPLRDERGAGSLTATVLAALCVLAVVAAVVLTVWLRGETSDREQAEEDRVALRQAAERFTETWNTFEAGQTQEYVESVSPLLSAKFRAEFEQAATDVATGIDQQGLSSEGEVLVDEDETPLIGIASVDADSAEVLVVSDALRVSNGQQVERHWRWQVSFVKADGEWLVDSFKEV